MSREPAHRLEDILEPAHLIATYVDGFEFESFIEDRRTVDAVVRDPEIIGRRSNTCPMK